MPHKTQGHSKITLDLKEYNKKLDEFNRLKAVNAKLIELLTEAKLYLDAGDYKENEVQYLLCKDIEQALLHAEGKDRLSITKKVFDRNDDFIAEGKN